MTDNPSSTTPDFEFIDAHVHFYDLGHPTLAYSWLEPDFVHPAIGNIDAIKTYRYLLDNYVAETRFAGVVGAVHVQAALGQCRSGGRERVRQRSTDGRLDTRDARR